MLNPANADPLALSSISGSVTVGWLVRWLNHLFQLTIWKIGRPLAAEAVEKTTMPLKSERDGDVAEDRLRDPGKSGTGRALSQRSQVHPRRRPTRRQKASQAGLNDSKNVTKGT